MNKQAKNYKQWYARNRAERILYWKAWREKLKRETLQAYGKLKCSKCHERNLELLTLDHVDNDGRDHRRAIAHKKHGGGGIQFYAWLKRNSFPKSPKLQVLCKNCNHLKHLEHRGHGQSRS